MRFIKLVISICCIFKSSFIFSNTWIGATDEDFPPYSYIQNGKKIGLDTEIVKLVFKNMNQKIEIETYPWARVISLLEKGSIHFAWQFVDSPERREKFLLSGPIREGVTVFIVPKKSKIKNWNEFTDFSNKHVGVVIGFKYIPEFDSLTTIQRDESRNVQALILKVANNRVDAAIGDLASLKYYADKNNVQDKIRFLPKVIKKVPRFVGFNKEEEIKFQQFSKSLEEVKNSEEYNKLILKYQPKL